jgi:hypothetical protein
VCPECNAHIGKAVGPAVEAATVWTRKFDTGFIAVNFGTTTESVVLDGAYTYTDITTLAPVTSPVDILAGNATILLATKKASDPTLLTPTL